jgi:protein SCO1/2
MKSKIAIALLLVVTFAAVTFAAIIARRNAANNDASSTQAFEVRGVVRAIDPKLHRLRVEHGEIPDFMPAMTMWLPVRKGELLNNLEPGDAITFRLEVTEDDSWISRIAKLSIGGASANTFATKAATSSVERENERLKPGERIPDFPVTDQDGRAIKLSDFRGKAVVVNFIYTRCPLPNFCPALSRNTAALQKELAAKAPGGFHIISITIDPEYDTPLVLKRYASLWTTNQQTWTFASASREELTTIAGYFGLIHERAAAGLVDHDLRTALISAEGKLVHVWKSNFWKPSEVVSRLNEGN